MRIKVYLAAMMAMPLFIATAWSQQQQMTPSQIAIQNLANTYRLLGANVDSVMAEKDKDIQALGNLAKYWEDYAKGLEEKGNHKEGVKAPEAPNGGDKGK